MRKIIILSMLVLLAGCSAHRIDVEQGNLLTEEQLARLSVGMDQHKVRTIAGTPLLRDPFHANRWDYYYSFKPGREPAISRRVTLHFADGRLSRIEHHGELPKDERATLSRPGREE